MLSGVLDSLYIVLTALAVAISGEKAGETASRGKTTDFGL
ncbi:hypothetical protein PL10110_250011 [Planktothrix agardhii]|nr:hypothetical protein PL10110_250011 [Planktothrix agardhii]